MTTRTLDLDKLHLRTGSHDPNDEQRMCVMEAVAFLAGEEWSDHPACASRIVGTFLRSWNDVLPDDQRQELRQYIPRLVGSAGTPEQEERRSWMALDWLVRVQTPAWLRLAGLTEQADMLTGMAEVTPETCPSIKAPLQAVRQDAAAAWDAAWAAARAAAWDAARAAARAAAWDAAWAAARAAAWAAAWAAARAAAWDAAWDAARDAAWAAARAAAGAAARELAPTVDELRAEAHRLVDRMLAVTE